MELISVACWCAEKHFTKAVDLYTMAIDLAPENAILYANRAAAHIRLENYGSALADASSAIDKDPKYIKVLPCNCMRCAGEGQHRKGRSTALPVLI